MTEAPAPRSSAGASLVAAGILVSRLFGLVRQRVIGHFLGSSAAGDAFSAAMRIPNVLQNLFGEGVLSASFIPIYARLIADGDEREAGRVAGAVATLLALASAVLVVLGIAVAPQLVTLIAGGLGGEPRELTIRLVRILFPGVGLLVLSAWCLGVLNSRRRFFLSYASPVAWNVAIIAALVGLAPGGDPARAATIAAWGAVAGSALQLLVQLPTVVRLDRALRLSMGTGVPGVRAVFAGFGPVFIGRGVVQLSGWIDQLIASFVTSGAMAVLFYAQNIALLPVSLFGMSVSAAELPELSSRGGADAAPHLRVRLDGGLRRIAFFVVPSAMAFLALGDIVAASIYQSGLFTRDTTVWVWGVLAGSAIGLLAGTLSRLYSSAFYALRDTRTPLNFALVRVALTTALGYFAAIPGPRWLGLDARWGVAGLTATAGVAAWVEFALLRRALNHRIGPTGIPGSLVVRLWGAAAAAAVPAYFVKLMLGVEHPVLLGLVAIPLYCGSYLAIATAIRVEMVGEVRAGLGRLLRR